MCTVAYIPRAETQQNGVLGCSDQPRKGQVWVRGLQRVDGEEACEKCGAESRVSDSLARQFVT
jgi:hypothetical protein